MSQHNYNIISFNVCNVMEKFDFSRKKMRQNYFSIALLFFPSYSILILKMKFIRYQLDYIASYINEGKFQLSNDKSQISRNSILNDFLYILQSK